MNYSLAEAPATHRPRHGALLTAALTAAAAVATTVAPR